jgi:gliding motility-associated-like protein
VSGISISGIDAGNYTLTSVIATTNADITAKSLTITADNKSKVYGAANPALTVTYTGLVNGDLAPSTLPTISTTALLSSPVGTYPITASLAADANYTISYVNGTLSVTSATLTITADNKTKVYGSANPTLTVTYTGLVNGDVAPSTLPTISTTALLSSPVGTYPITATGAADANYTISYVAGTLSVTSATLTVTADNKTKVYGAVNPALTVTYTGLVNGDVAPSTLPTISTTALLSSPVGTYPITATGAADANYTISYVAGTLAVTSATLIITATPGQTKVYGTADPTSYTYTLSTPLLPGDALTGALSRTAGENVGIFAINQGTLTNANYDITYVGSNFTITPAALSITGITGANKIYDGTTNATINGTASYVGLVSADAGLAVAGSPSFNFNNKNVDISKPITVTGFASPSANYTLTQPTGLTGDITPKTAIINAVANNKQYDGTTTAIVNLSSPSFITSDIVTINYGSATFDTKEIGTNKTVTVTGINLGSIDAPNYVLASTIATALADITAPPVFNFEIPNAFTPNGDGLNDILKIIGNSGVKELKGFKIYSRSGNLVFETRDLSVGWDGRFKGNMLPSDIYYWTAVYVDRNDQTNSKTGTVLLLK